MGEGMKEFSYDALRRKATESISMPSWPSVGTMTAEFTYDAKNRNKSIRDYQGMQADYNYDDVSRTQTIDETSFNRTHTRQFNAGGHLTSKSNANGDHRELHLR